VAIGYLFDRHGNTFCPDGQLFLTDWKDIFGSWEFNGYVKGLTAAARPCAYLDAQGGSQGPAA
jgi:hypothetical protein